MDDARDKAEAPQSLWQVLKGSAAEWSKDNVSSLSAAVTYYAIFSIGPLLIISIATVGLIYGKRAAQGQIEPRLAQFVGEAPAKFMQEMVVRARFSPGLSWAGILSVILIVYAAANLFAALQGSLNTIFDVRPKPHRSWLAWIRNRAMTFLMVLGTGAVVLATIVGSTILAAAGKWSGGTLLHGHPTAAAWVMQGVSFIVSLALFTGIFAMIFKFLPDIEIDWKDTLIGAAVTAALFSLARIGLGYYLSRSSTAGPFGAAGSLVIVMLFIYYSMQIFFWGAEFTQVWACRRGKPVKPSKDAIALGGKFARQRAAQAQVSGSGARTEAPAKRAGGGHWWKGQPAGWREVRRDQRIQSSGG